MALVSNIQLQNGAVKPPNLDTNLKYTAAGLTATEAIAVGTVPVSTSGSITVKSANDIRNWIQTTKTDGNVEIYMSNDARPDWALRVAGTADNAFVIANSYGSNCTAQFPAFSIGGAGAVGLGKTGATNILDIAYKNSATGGIQLTETQNSVGAKLIAEATSASIGSTSNHKLGFRVNGTTVAAFNTSTQFGIGTDSPGATLDVRGGAIFNEAGAAVDFRIEGDAEPNLFFVDGSADAIGMGTATPVDTSRLHIMGTDGDPAAAHSGDAMVIIENCGQTFLELATGNANHAGLTFSDAGAATRGAVAYDHGTGLGGAADTMYFQTAGSLRVAIDSSGEVGIGTLAPASALHLAGVDDPEIRIQAATDGDPQINFYQGASTCRGTIMYKDTGDNFVMDSDGKVTLQTSSTPRLVITNAGCVGIGTNAVASGCGAELDIFSAGASTGLMLRSGNSSAAASTIVGEGYRANGDSEQVLQIYGRNKNGGLDLGILEISAESVYCLGSIEFKTFDGSSMTTKMQIKSDGNIGVGTATPISLSNQKSVTIHGSSAARLDMRTSSGNGGQVFATSSGVTLQGNTGAPAIIDGGSGCYVRFDVGSSEQMRLTTTGLGIGTTTPTAPLEIRSCGNNRALVINAVDNYEALQFQCAGTDVGYIFHEMDCRIYIGAKGEIIFRTGGCSADSMGTDALLIDSSQNVGIGTATMCHRLDINESTGCLLRLRGCSGFNYDLESKTNGYHFDHQIGSGNAIFSWSDSAAEMMRIDQTGLGIGTAAPSSPLHVQLASDSNNIMELDNAAGCQVFQFFVTAAGGTLNIRDKAGFQHTQLSSYEDSFIARFCNLGVGTGTPSTKLDVFGGGVQVKDTGGGCIQLVRNDGTGTSGEFLGVLDFVSTDASTGSCGTMARLAATYDSAGDSAALRFVTGTSTGSGTPTLTERMTILSGGNVGIGTTVPAGALHIDGTGGSSNTTSQLRLSLDGTTEGIFGVASFANNIITGSAQGDTVIRNDGGSIRFSVDSGTSVAAALDSTGLGIGTNNPSNKLHVKTTAGGDFQVAIMEGGIQTFLYADTAFWGYGDATAYGGNLWGGHKSNCYLLAYTNSSEKLRITSGGDVGIGTTAPAGRLAVMGAADNTQWAANICDLNTVCSYGLRAFGKGSKVGFPIFLVHHNSDELFRVDTGGNANFLCNVGIGTNAPQTSLQIIDTGTNPKIHVGHASADLQGYRLEFSHTQQTGGIDFTTSSPHANLDLYAGGSPANSGGWCGQIRFFTGGANQAGTERVRIDPSGNVGIGTTTPCAPLQVCGNTVLNTTFVEGKLTVQDGNYGIGGEARGDVSLGTIAIMGCSPAAGCVLPITFNMTAASSRARAAIAGVDLGSVGYCMGLAFYTRGAADGTALTTADEKMRILHNGAVGIGTTLPTARLDVAGTGGGVPCLAVPAGGVFIRVTDTNTVGQGAVLRLQSTCGAKETAATLSAVNTSDNNGDLAFNMYAGGADHPERMRLTSAGVLGIGNSPLGNVFYEGNFTSKLQVMGTDATSSITVLRQHSLYGPAFIAARNGGDPGTNTLVDATEGVGSVNFQANDGAKYVQVAAMNVNVGSKAAASCMSGNIRFTTNGGSNGSLVERMRIHDCGRVSIGTDAECIARVTSQTSTVGDYAYIGLTTGNDRGAVAFGNTATAFNDTMFVLTSCRASTTAYDFARYNNTTSMVYRVEGDGGVSSDVGFTTPAADYSEFFESTTGVASERGRAVVLDGDKIRYYNSTTDELDSIIGVTRPKEDSSTAAFVGNSAWNHWQGKYLTDDWGVYICETVTTWEWSVETETGSETCSAYERDKLAEDPSWTPPAGAVSSLQSVRKLNPAYDESLDSGYQPRKSRDEWWLIGLLGQVPVKAGEPVNPRWIKMKDISAGVEYYYIR